jgi:hypothetical protein
MVKAIQQEVALEEKTAKLVLCFWYTIAKNLLKIEDSQMVKFVG